MPHTTRTTRTTRTARDDRKKLTPAERLHACEIAIASAYLNESTKQQPFVPFRRLYRWVTANGQAGTGFTWREIEAALKSLAGDKRVRLTYTAGTTPTAWRRNWPAFITIKGFCYDAIAIEF